MVLNEGLSQKNLRTFQIKRLSKRAGSSAGAKTRARRAVLQWNRKGLSRGTESGLNWVHHKLRVWSNWSPQTTEKPWQRPLSAGSVLIALWSKKKKNPHKRFFSAAWILLFQTSSVAKCQGLCFQRVVILRCIYFGLLYNVCRRFFVDVAVKKIHKWEFETLQTSHFCQFEKSCGGFSYFEQVQLWNCNAVPLKKYESYN